MASVADTLIKLHLRFLVKPLLASVASQPLLRKLTGLYAALVYRRSSDMAFEVGRLGCSGVEVPVLWCREGQARADQVMLYLHGGAYTIGGYVSHRGLAARLSGACGLPVALLDYRLAPENPFPAALDDALTAYRALLARGYAADAIALAGDSAGGGLTFALLHRIGRLGLPKPGAVVTLSPWTDLSLSSRSFRQNGSTEFMLPGSWLRRAHDLYLSGQNETQPEASPILANFVSPPPCLLLVGSGEILLDDSRGVAAKLRQAGGDVTLIEVDDAPHVWPLYQGRLRAADEAIATVAAFVRTHLRSIARPG